MCPTKKIKTPTLVEIVSINPYSSVDDHFPFFYEGIDLKVLLNSQQQVCGASCSPKICVFEVVFVPGIRRVIEASWNVSVQLL
jgi:hypothetical protein